ncbi:iron chaperone [Roseivirga seohaensis]|uniref:iron chaperone n=1 Tax=Roseivirga seohaensis TaxID=1914963 RepID=UPI003BAA2831
MKQSIEVAQYISGFSDEVSSVLSEIRTLIQQAVPNAEECISYGIPTFKLNGKSLVHFAAYKNHIGFYATPTGHTEFAKELSQYKQGKGSVQFPLSQPMPLNLIKRIVEFRMKEVLKTN